VVLRIIGILLAVTAIPLGCAMVLRRLRVLTRGRIVEGSIVDIVAARAGGAYVYQLTVASDEPGDGTHLVRSYREFDIDTRVRIRVHASDPAHGWLAEWSHVGYELGIGLSVAAAGVLAGFAALTL
jgi:hypothetical protein